MAGPRRDTRVGRTTASRSSSSVAVSPPRPAAGRSSPESVTVRSTAPRPPSVVPMLAAASTIHSRLSAGGDGSPGAPKGAVPASRRTTRWARERVSSNSVAWDRQGRSSRRTMSSPVRAVARQCTLRRSSPCRYSRVLTSSSPCTAIDRRAPSPPPPCPPEGPPRPSGRTRGTTSSGGGVGAGRGALDEAEGVDEAQPQRAEHVPATPVRRARGSAAPRCRARPAARPRTRGRSELGRELLRRAATARPGAGRRW